MPAPPGVSPAAVPPATIDMRFRRTDKCMALLLLWRQRGGVERCYCKPVLVFAGHFDPYCFRCSCRSSSARWHGPRQPNVELLWPRGAPAENSVQFYLALRRAGLQAEMHIYRAGRHGLGLAGKVPGTSTWSDRLKEWMQTQGLLGSKKQSAGAFHAPYGFTARTVTPCSHRAARDPLRHWSEDEIAWP